MSFLRKSLELFSGSSSNNTSSDDISKIKVNTLNSSTESLGSPRSVSVTSPRSSSTNPMEIPASRDNSWFRMVQVVEAGSLINCILVNQQPPTIYWIVPFFLSIFYPFLFQATATTTEIHILAVSNVATSQRPSSNLPTTTTTTTKK
ncbi:hypothetical protein DFA_11333 [Cavenderia fasciculata]|uniref:Transmembrane protein n=1 Tax=Cavenderia fasciculata TaxID=261658 RepID=F4QCD7_CACFS|nr:uncharacterized protein DFA_11333 [Cavenderia fasciculata]EGG13572.1 hypothetical protein DFA_11333 [Cavenderia fasciculata]|eukprot:XP_004350276.1 hypothetical protein DFA_11333 [Cavenderia fasciculata]